MIVLDTAALISWLSGHGELSQAAREAIECERHMGEIAISVISALDVSQYIDDGRLKLSINTRIWLSTLASIEGIRVVPIDTGIAVRAATLPSVLSSHQRLIGATATALGASLITPDALLREFAYAEVIW